MGLTDDLIESTWNQALWRVRGKDQLLLHCETLPTDIFAGLMCSKFTVEFFGGAFPVSSRGGMERDVMSGFVAVSPS